jgi:hypothetical protein
MNPNSDPPLHLLPGSLGIARLAPEAALPEWARQGVLWAAVRSLDELSMICEERFIPPEVRAERGWRALQIEGPLDFSMLGVLAGIAGVLAEAGVSIFVLSTYDTDTVLVKETALDRALAALRGAGYLVFEPVDLGG